MSADRPGTAGPLTGARTLGAIRDCWNTIGVRGDHSCPELERHVHCHNCPVYSAAAAALLDRDVSEGDLGEHTRHFAQPDSSDERGTESVVIFRIGAEWLALPTAIVKEVADLRPIHSIPHRRGGAILGVANVRGELVVCVALDRLLGAAHSEEANSSPGRVVHRRLLVLRRGEIRAVCPADEVHGIHRLHSSELQDIPATVGKAGDRHSKALIRWQGRSVGVLDDELVFQNLRRSLA
jgi:chemotaxis-related protein WspD